MRISIFITVALFNIFVANGQSSVSDKLYDFLKNQEGVSLLSFSKSMIDMVDMNIGKDEDGKKVIGPLNEVRVAICKRGDATESKIADYLKKSPFQEVDMEDKNKGEELKVYVQRKGRTIQECHVTIPGSDKLILVSFYGEFKVEDVDGLRKSAVNISWD